MPETGQPGPAKPFRLPHRMHGPGPAKLFLLYIILWPLSSPEGPEKLNFSDFQVLFHILFSMTEKRPGLLGRGAQAFCQAARIQFSIRPELSSAGRSAIYSTTAATVLIAALMTQAAAFQASVKSAAGLPRISSL